MGVRQLLSEVRNRVDGNSFEVWEEADGSVAAYANGTALGGAVAPTALVATRSTTSADNGALLENSTASTFTLTLVAGTTPRGFTVSNIGAAGQVVVTTGAGVTFVDGSSSASATFQGQMIHIIPTTTANLFLTKVG